MQGDLIDRFRPCGAQARVGDRHRRNSSRCGVRVKADAAQCAHRKAVRSGDGLLLGEQGQVYCAGIVCFVPQGDALFADRYAAAVGGKPRDGWLTCAGRLAFPIFAFMAVEGYFHTHSFRKYALRLALFAVLSEVPFDLMYGGTWFYPVHQNVIWTLLLGLLGIHLMETVRKKQKTWLYLLTALLVVLIGTVLGTLSMVDYYGTGVLTIFIFYFFRGRKWWCLAGQLLALYWVNVQLLGGLLYPVHIFGMEFEICQQGLALLALLPIWLYRGRQGYHSKPFQYACYAFYPVHMLILVLILQYLTR